MSNKIPPFQDSLFDEPENDHSASGQAPIENSQTDQHPTALQASSSQSESAFRVETFENHYTTLFGWNFSPTQVGDQEGDVPIEGGTYTVEVIAVSRVFALPRDPLQPEDDRRNYALGSIGAHFDRFASVIFVGTEAAERAHVKRSQFQNLDQIAFALFVGVVEAIESISRKYPRGLDNFKKLIFKSHRPEDFARILQEKSIQFEVEEEEGIDSDSRHTSGNRLDAAMDRSRDFTFKYDDLVTAFIK